MIALTTSLGRLPTLKKNRSKKQVKPINVQVAQQYHFENQLPFLSVLPKSSSPMFSPATTASPLSCDSAATWSPPLSSCEFTDSPASSTVKSPFRRFFSRAFSFGKSQKLLPNQPSPKASPKPIHEVIHKIGQQTAHEANRQSGNQPDNVALLLPKWPTPSTPPVPLYQSKFPLQTVPQSPSWVPSSPIRDFTPIHHRSTKKRPATASPATRFQSVWTADSFSLSPSTAQPYSKSSASLPASPSSPAFPSFNGVKSSLRAIRKLHAAASPLTRSNISSASQRSAKPDGIPRSTSDESFCCRGLGFEVWESDPPGPKTATPLDVGIKKKTRFAVDSIQESNLETDSFNNPHCYYSTGFVDEEPPSPEIIPAAIASSHISHHPIDLQEPMDSPPFHVTGLGLTCDSPSAPRPKPKRLPTEAQPFPSDCPMPCQLSNQQGQDESSTVSPWFSSYPQTLPSPIRHQIRFERLPKKIHRGYIDLDNNVEPTPQPFDSLFVPCNYSVLDLKEIIAARLASYRYMVNPRDLILSLYLQQKHFNQTATPALGLTFNAEGQPPVKRLTHNSRLLFEGAQQDDVLAVRYYPSTRFI